MPADASDDQIYTYNMPAASDARLPLALSGIEIGEFLARHTEQGVVAEDITASTLEATAMQHGTSCSDCRSILSVQESSDFVSPGVSVGGLQARRWPGRSC